MHDITITTDDDLRTISNVLQKIFHCCTMRTEAKAKILLPWISNLLSSKKCDSLALAISRAIELK
jgi:hypothetical protein